MFFHTQAKFRSALGNANRLIAAVKILGELEAACALLAWAMGQDVLEAFSPPLNRFHNATAVDTLGLGVREAMEFALGSKEAGELFTHRREILSTLSP